MKYIYLYENFQNGTDEMIAYVVEAMGFECTKIERLGSGANGVAFSVNDTMVLKITNDMLEAKVCSWLSDYSFYQFAKIHAVGKLNQTSGIVVKNTTISFLPVPNLSRMYFILQEKLQTSAVQIEVSELCFVVMSNTDYVPMKQTILSIFKKVKFKNFIHTNYPNLVNIYNECFAVLDELERFYKMKIYDFQPGNIGRRGNGQLALFDVEIKGKRKSIPVLH